MLFDDLHQRLSQIADRARGIAISPDAERILAAQFKQIRNFVEDLSDFRVFHVYNLRIGVESGQRAA